MALNISFQKAVDLIQPSKKKTNKKKSAQDPRSVNGTRNKTRYYPAENFLPEHIFASLMGL